MNREPQDFVPRIAFHWHPTSACCPRCKSTLEWLHNAEGAPLHIVRCPACRHQIRMTCTKTRT